MGARNRALRAICEYASLDGGPEAVMSVYDRGLSYSGSLMCELIEGQCERFHDGTLFLKDAIGCCRRFGDEEPSYHVLRVPAGDPRIEVAERLLIGHVLEHSKWNVSRSAQKLGIHRTTLLYKMKKYGFSRP